MADEKKAVTKVKKPNFFVRFGRGFVNFFVKIGLAFKNMAVRGKGQFAAHILPGVQ